MLGPHFSFYHLSIVYNDPLTPVKHTIYLDNSSLLVFQTDRPMFSFLIAALDKLVRSFFTKLIKKNNLKNACTTLKLIRIDVTKKENHSLSDADLGSGIKHNLKKLHSKKQVTAKHLQFQARSSRILCFII